MQNGLHPYLLLDQDGKRLIAHTRRSPGAVRNIDDVNSQRLEITRPFNLFGGINAFRRNNLHHGHKLAARNLGAQARALFERRHHDLNFFGRLCDHLEAGAFG